MVCGRQGSEEPYAIKNQDVRCMLLFWADGWTESAGTLDRGA